MVVNWQEAEAMGAIPPSHSRVGSWEGGDAGASAGLDAWLKQAAGRIAAALGLPRDEARLEARVLAAHALGVNRTWLVAHGRDVLTPDQRSAVDACLARRLRGEPVAYITGRREFFGLEFSVTPDVLIPRPETETLVEAALERLPADRPCRVLDLGTGSGVIALALAHRRHQARVVGVDYSPDALDVARRNAVALELERRVEWVRSDWYPEDRVKNFDMIVSNPPYVAEADPHLTRGDLRHEPRGALAAGPDGLDAIRAIVCGAPARLRAGGWLLLEHGYDQAPACRALMARAGLVELVTIADLAGLPRVTGGRLPAARDGGP